MSQPARSFDLGSNTTISHYWPGSLPADQVAREWQYVDLFSPSTSATAGLTQAAAVARRYDYVMILDVESRGEADDLSATILRPMETKRLHVTIRNQGRGAFLPFD